MGEHESLQPFAPHPCQRCGSETWTDVDYSGCSDCREPAEDEKPSVEAFRRWHVRSREINEVVQASDQWEAWDTLRDRSAFDFGLIVVAEPNEDADPIPVQTATLMRRWGRDEDAEQFDAIAREAGLIE